MQRSFVILAGTLALSLAACHGADSSIFAADAQAAPLPPAAALAALAAPTLAAPAVAAGTTTTPDSLLAPMPSLAPLVKRLRPVVVNINSKFRPRPQRRRGLSAQRDLRNPDGNEDGDDNNNGEDGQNDQDPMQRFFHFFGPHGAQPQDNEPRSGLGSGFLIGDGLVITNNHVVQVQDSQGGKFRPMDEIKIITDPAASGGAREYAAKIIGADPKSDIALLKIDDPRAKDLVYAQLGDSDALEVGDYVVAIGEPFGLQATVTAGIVSAKERSQFGGPYSDYLQTDASINPGNSGGPLFNLRGEVVGVNAAIISGANTIGFAIPISVVKQILPQLRQNGKVVRGFLGVQLQALNQDTADHLGLKNTQGALVTDVVHASGADKAGVRAGDVITQVDGKMILDNNMLTREVGSMPPGRAVKVVAIRDGQEKAFDVSLQKRPEEAEEILPEPAEQPSGDPLGLVVDGLTPALAQRAHVDPGTKGVVVTDVTPDSPAGGLGLEPGDVLIEMNRAPIASVADYKKALKNVKPGETVLLRVRRENSVEYLTVRVPK